VLADWGRTAETGQESGDEICCCCGSYLDDGSSATCAGSGATPRVSPSPTRASPRGGRAGFARRRSIHTIVSFFVCSLVLFLGLWSARYHFISLGIAPVSALFLYSWSWDFVLSLIYSFHPCSFTYHLPCSRLSASLFRRYPVSRLNRRTIPPTIPPVHSEANIATERPQNDRFSFAGLGLELRVRHTTHKISHTVLN
jgi:hypothetical protein